jgi:hypothetical protein
MATLKAEGTTKDTQPIDRIMAVMKGINAHDHEQLQNVWARALGVDTALKSLWPALVDFNKLIERVKEQITSDPNLAADNALIALANLQSLCFAQNMGDDFNHKASQFNEVTRELRWVHDMLIKRPSVEKKIPDEEIRSVENQITETMALIEADATLPDSVKRLLLQLADQMRAAVRMYKTFGIEPIERALGMAIVKVGCNPQVMQVIVEKEKEGNPAVKSYKTDLTRVGAILGTANNIANLLKLGKEAGEFLGNLLGGGQ